jgi:hydroxymethylglutaryl-CoA lyase
VAHALTLDGLTVAALVPNLRGAENAVAAGVHKINYVLSASEAHNRANVRRSLDASIEDFGNIVAFIASQPADKRPVVTAGIATAFGCTIQGEVPETHVIQVAARLAELGADELLLADTVGYGDPAKVRRLVPAVKAEIGPRVLGLHLHDTRGLGIANALAAWDCGVRHFDASLGGLGGCQFAPGATGNVVMEDLVFMFEAMGFRTGIDIDALIEIRERLVAELTDAQFEGALVRAGLPKGFSYSDNLQQEASHNG